MDRMPFMDRIPFQAGTVVKIDGLPFALEADTTLLGNQANVGLIRERATIEVPGTECACDDYSGLRDDLAALLNRHSMENGSDTPDFILARFLTGCLRSFDEAVSDRTRWHDPKTEGA